MNIIRFNPYIIAGSPRFTSPDQSLDIADGHGIHLMRISFVGYKFFGLRKNLPGY